MLLPHRKVVDESNDLCFHEKDKIVLTHFIIRKNSFVSDSNVLRWKEFLEYVYFWFSFLFKSILSHLMFMCTLLCISVDIWIFMTPIQLVQVTNGVRPDRPFVLWADLIFEEKMRILFATAHTTHPLRHIKRLFYSFIIKILKNFTSNFLLL